MSPLAVSPEDGFFLGRPKLLAPSTPNSYMTMRGIASGAATVMTQKDAGTKGAGEHCLGADSREGLDTQTGGNRESAVRGPSFCLNRPEERRLTFH